MFDFLVILLHVISIMDLCIRLILFLHMFGPIICLQLSVFAHIATKSLLNIEDLFKRTGKI